MTQRAPVPPTIRPLRPEHRAAWEPLWHAYQAFYDRTVAPAVTESAWQRLTHSHEIEGFLAFSAEGEAVGLAHFLFHPALIHPGGSCYLPDLYVVPATRGLGVGRRLIAAVAEAARARGAAVLYWQTEEFNGPARRLYEKVAKRSPFIRYQIEL